MNNYAVSQVHLACGRIIGGARAILEAYRFGVVEGAVGEPWSDAYHRKAVDIYAMSLPVAYQRDIQVLFSRSRVTMAALAIPGGMADDWAIVMDYLFHASRSIDQWLAAPSSRAVGFRPVPAPKIDRHTPEIIRFELLARLTTAKAASRLEQAATAVHQYVGGMLSTPVLDEKQQQLLGMVSSGVHIVDIASELCYSERTVYRELAKLWKVLGVSNRAEGLRKAASEGFID